MNNPVISRDSFCCFMFKLITLIKSYNKVKSNTIFFLLNMLQIYGFQLPVSAF